MMDMKLQDRTLQDTKLRDTCCFVRSISTIDPWTEAAVSEHAQNSLIAGLIELDDRCELLILCYIALPPFNKQSFTQCIIMLRVQKITTKNCVFYSFVRQFYVLQFYALQFGPSIHVLQFHVLQFWWSVIFMSVIFSRPPWASTAYATDPSSLGGFLPFSLKGLQ